MIYRAIRVKATGQWLNALMTQAGDKFSSNGNETLTAVSAMLEMSESELEIVDDSTDPRTGTLLDVPTVSVTPSRQEELVAIGKDAWTDAQQKELIELLASG